MYTPIMATKFYIPPRRPNAVPRIRLMEKLQHVWQSKLTLISAPAGYGKTTLVCEWLADCGRPAAWLSLEEEDNEISRFLTCFIYSLQTVEEGVGAGVLAVLQSPEPPPIETLLAILLQEIAAIPSPLILVLDDYHAARSKPVDDAVSFLLNHLSAQMHLVMTTREDPQVPLARLRARGQLTELRAADMRFTLSEAESFLNRTMELNLPLDQIASLEMHTEGWAAGLQLAALSIEGDRGNGRFIRTITGSHHFVLDYLVEEVLHRLPDDVQSFLMRTSILDRLCGSLCDDVLFTPEPTGVPSLIDLERSNLFVVPLDNERRWYRYHHLFAESLRRRLQERLDGSNIAELHKRASEWYERHGFEIDAFRHAVEAEDIARAARLLEGGGLPLHLRGAASLTLQWLKSLPVAELDARPSLWVMYGSALLIAGKPTNVEPKLRAAEAALQGASQDVRNKDLIGLISATRAALASLMMAGKPDDGHRKLQAAEATMQVTELEDKTNELVELIAPAREGGVDRRNEIEAVIFQSRRALEYLHPDNLPVRAAAAWMLGVACHRSGDRAGARKAYHEAIAYSHTLGHELMVVTSLIGLGQIQEAENDPEQSAEYYEEALRLAGDLPLPALREAQLGLERIRIVQNRRTNGNLIEPLSQRELEVLELIADGYSNREIGNKLFLALDTVKGHNRRIFEKLQASRRTEAIKRAIELNLLKNSPKGH
ncbi:LuxR C-terminal-related transcriptional regulator [Cohnella soli]|uniref:LuxR C-terminal-related transcriptional regulator n=1 Tax=Cohnella soli TaxID=425005 RepID=A0ABW0I4Y0_9BACL